MTNVRPEVLEELHNTIHQLRDERDALQIAFNNAFERGKSLADERDALRAELDALHARLMDTLPDADRRIVGALR